MRAFHLQNVQVVVNTSQRSLLPPWLVSLSLSTFPLFFPGTVFSDPAAIRAQTTFFLLSCCCWRPQDRNCGRKRMLMQPYRPAGQRHGNQDLRLFGRAGSPGLPLPLVQHLPFPVPQYLSAHGGHAPHFPLFLISLLLSFPPSSLGTWLIYSLSHGAAYVIADESWNRPIKNKS